MPPGPAPKSASGLIFAWVIIPQFPPVSSSSDHVIRVGVTSSFGSIGERRIRAGQSKQCIPLTTEIGSEKNMWPNPAEWNAFPGLLLELSGKRLFSVAISQSGECKHGPVGPPLGDACLRIKLTRRNARQSRDRGSQVPKRWLKSLGSIVHKDKFGLVGCLKLVSAGFPSSVLKNGLDSFSHQPPSPWEILYLFLASTSPHIVCLSVTLD